MFSCKSQNVIMFISLSKGIIDNSGLVFTYLDEPRQHNAGILFFGHQVRYTMVIPPSAQNYTIPALCPSECTEQVADWNILKTTKNYQVFFVSHSFSLLVESRYLPTCCTLI